MWVTAGALFGLSDTEYEFAANLYSSLSRGNKDATHFGKNLTLRSVACILCNCHRGVCSCALKE